MKKWYGSTSKEKKKRNKKLSLLNKKLKSKPFLIKRTELKKSERIEFQQHRELLFQLNSKLNKKKKPESLPENSKQKWLLKKKLKLNMKLLSRRPKLKELLRLQLKEEQERPQDLLKLPKQMLKNKLKLPVCPSVKLLITCVPMMVRSRKRMLRSKKKMMK